jgi:F0F1-type ATP synthase delta subunit
MVRIIQVADDGTERAAVELDDFTVEVIYSGIADMLRDAENAQAAQVVSTFDLSREERQRREKVLTKIRG